MNARSKDLAIVTPMSVTERASQALSKTETEAEIKKLVEQSKPIIAVTDNASREICHASLMTLKTLRVAIEKRGKEGRAEAVEYSKAVIAIEKELVALVSPEETRLAVLRDAFDAEKERKRQEEIDKEIARVKAIKERIEELRGCQVLTPASGSELIGQHIADLQAIAVDDSFAEFADQASSVKAATMQRLTALFDAAMAHEVEQQRLADERAELARLKAEETERQRIAAEERAKQEAADAARRKAEDDARAKLEAEAKAKREDDERVAKIQRDAEAQVAKAEHQRLIDEARAHAQAIAAERAENDRIAEEQRQANAAEAARIAEERAQVERDRDALIAAQAKPEPVEDDCPTVTVPTIAEVTETLTPMLEVLERNGAIISDTKASEAPPPVYRLEPDSIGWTIAYLDSEGDTVFVGTSWEYEDEAEEVCRLMEMAFAQGRVSMIPKVA